MSSIMVPVSCIEGYDADKYFSERFPSDYTTMSANPNYSSSGCGISVTPTDTEQILSIKDPTDNTKELCKLKYTKTSLKFVYSKANMVNNIVNIGIGSSEKLTILENAFKLMEPSN